jgi:actin-like ATPase involved in cell morphogenesis
MEMKREHLVNLAYAKGLLEKPSLAARITTIIGTPIEKGFAMLPDRWSDAVQDTTRTALQRALEAAVATMDDRPRVLSMDAVHKGIVATTGAVGGAFGLGALAIELPISTVVMLRSIADIARSEGESVRTIETKLACLEVFALGGSANTDDATDAGYYAVRAGLARAVAEAARHIAERGLVIDGGPAVVRLIGAIASRFGVVVSEKIAAQAVPVVGAAGGALVNTLFIDHFQNMARGHFIVRRLEKEYGKDVVERAYLSL